MALPQDETTTEQPSIDYEALGLEPVSDEELFGFGLQTEAAEPPKAETPEIDYEALGLEPIGEVEQFGFELPAIIPKPEESFLRPVADPLLNIGAGINDVVKGFTDAFGADNPVSQNLAKNSEWYRSLLSAGAKQDQEEIGRIMQEAEGQGVLAEIGAGLKALSVAPVDLVAQGIGSLIPFIATAGVGKAVGLSKAGIAVLQGVQGGVVGGGIVKGEIYEAVKEQLINSGVDEAKAEKAAMEAQSYNGKNLDQIMLGVGLGVAASTTGADSAIRSLISRKVGKEAAEQVSEQAIQEVLRTGFVRGAVKDGIVEAATEGLQGGQERLAANIAVGREGFEVESMRGVFGQATLEGALGGVIGGGAGGISAKVEQMDARKKVALRDALKAAEEAKQSNAPASAAAVEEQINQTVEETPDERVARLQREAQEAAGDIELEEEVSGLPPVSELPPVKEGFVRLYHGGAGTEAGEFTPSLQQALGFAQQSKGSIFYVDVPQDSEFLRRSEYDEQGNISDRGILVSRQILPDDVASSAKRAASGFEAEPVTPTPEAPPVEPVAPVEPVVAAEGAVEPTVAEVAPTRRLADLEVRPPTDNVQQVAAANDLTVGRADVNIPAQELESTVNLSDPKERERVDNLKEQISSEGGFISRVIVDGQNNVVEGQHRVQAMKELGYDQIPAVQLKSAEDFIPDSNALDKVMQDAGLTASDNRTQMRQLIAEIISDEKGDVTQLREYEAPAGFETAWNAATEEVIRQNAAPEAPPVTPEAAVAPVTPEVAPARPRVTPEERIAKLDRLKEVKAEIEKIQFKPVEGAEVGLSGLTTEEAQRYSALMMEAEGIRFDLRKELKVEKIESEKERKSTIPPNIIKTASDELASDRGVWAAITEAAIGTFNNMDTAVDIVMDGKNPEVSPNQLYNAFNNTREALRQKFGDTITLYRAVGKQKPKATTNWLSTREAAMDYGKNVVEKEIPIDDIVALNVGLFGRYEEFIVGKKPEAAVTPAIPQLEPLRRVARAEQTEEDVAGLVDAGFAEVYKGQPVLTQAGLDALPEAERPRLTPEARKIQIDTGANEVAAEAISKNLRIGVDQIDPNVRMPAGWTLVDDIYIPPAVEAAPAPARLEPKIEADLRSQVVSEFEARSKRHKEFSEGLNKAVAANSLTEDGAILLREVFKDADPKLLGKATISINSRRRYLGVALRRGGTQLSDNAIEKALDGRFGENMTPEVMAMVVTHEIGHHGYNSILTKKERALIGSIFTKMGQNGRTEFFSRGAIEKPFQVKYHAKNQHEFFAQSFAEYVFSDRLPDPEIKPIFDRIIQKLKQAFQTLMNRNANIEQLIPLYEKLLGVAPTPEVREARREPAITPQQDADYLAAVEGGDLDAASRMVEDAARAAGYTFGPVWHGTRKEFTRFFGQPTYFSESEQFARYTVAGRQGRVIKAYLRGNLFDPRNPEHRAQVSEMERLYGKLPENPTYQYFNAAVQNWLQENGWDGHYEQESATSRYRSLVVFDPMANAKSAEPVTRDNQGNIIPLSQRFQPEEADIRYSYAGVRAQTPQFMRDSLSVAQAMAAKGEDAETIRSVTGWIVNPYDGKLRWEIPDNDAKFINLDDSELWVRDPDGSINSASGKKLSEILDHPNLFAAYPEIANQTVDILIVPRGGDASIGAYFANPYSGKANFEATGANQNRALSALLHEIQHWIQEKEGFSTGTNPQAFLSAPEIYKKWLGRRELMDLSKELGVSPVEAAEQYRRLDEYEDRRADARLWQQDPDMMTDETINRNLKYWRNRGKTDMYTAYERTAGEIESRDVQARMKMTPEQRKATAPYSSENISPEDAVIMGGEGGVAALRGRRVQMGRAGMEQAAVEARLQELGFPAGGIIRVVNEPDADFEGRTIIVDGKVTGIELNAAAMRDNATIDRVLNHEFAESANADGALNRLVERLTPKEKKEINDTITRLRYEERARTSEEAARAIETLAEAWKGRGFFTRAVARIEAWANKLGFKLTRRAAEYIAARNLAEVNDNVRKWNIGEAMANIKGARKVSFNGLQAILIPPSEMRVAYSIAAYHGTPHQIKGKFKLSKIGTGEGEQVFGWGLYFAENIDVAARYRDQLAKEEKYDGEEYNPNDPRHVAADKLAVGKMLDKTREEVIRDLEDNADLFSGSDKFKSITLKQAAEALRTNQEAKLERVGNIYSVDLDIEPDDVLDWDRFYSSQPEKIQKAIQSVLGFSEETKEYWLDTLREDLAENGPMGYPDSRLERVFEEMIAFGGYGEEFGAQVFDELREAAPEKADEFIDLVKRIGTGGLDASDTGETVYRMLVARFNSAEEASRRLLQAGVKGIKYLDGQSRELEKGTRNYVIFDEDVISITGRNGQPVDIRESRRQPEAIPTFTEGTPEAATLKEMEASMAKVDAASEAKGGKPETYKISEIASVWMDSGLGERELQDAIVEYTNLTPANAKKVARSIARQYGLQQQIAEALLETEQGISVEGLPDGAVIPPEVDPKRPKTVLQRVIDATTGVRVKPVKLEVNEKTVLKQQIRLKAASFRQAKKAQQEQAAEVVEAIKAMDIRGGIRPKQAAALMKRAALINFASEKSVDNFIAYAEKTIANANYDKDLADAKLAQKRAKELTKRKNIADNQKEVLRNTNKVEVSLLEDPREFADAVNHYLRGFKDVVSPDYLVVPDAELDSYLSAKKDEAENARAEIDFDTISDLAAKYGVPVSEVNNVLNAQDVEATLATYANRVTHEGLISDKAKDSQTALRNYDPAGLTNTQKKLIDRLLSVDVDSLNTESRVQMIRAVDNILVNNQTLGLQKFVDIAEGQSRAVKAAKDRTFKNQMPAWVNVFSKKLGEVAGRETLLVGSESQRKIALSVQSVADTFRNVFGKDNLGKIKRLMGFYDLERGTQDFNTEMNKISETFAEFFTGIEKKYGEKAVSDTNGLYAEGVVGYLIQKFPNKSESDSIATRRSVILEDIAERRKSGDRDQIADAQVIEDVLNKLDGNSVQEILNNLKREFPANHESLVWMKDTFLPQYKEFLKNFDENYNNQANNYDNPDYLPIKYKFRRLAELSPEDAKNFYDTSSLTPKQASNTIKRIDYTTLPSLKGNPASINYNLRSNVFSSLGDQLKRAYTSSGWTQVDAFMNSRAALEVFGNEANVQFVKDRLALLKDSQDRKTYERDGASQVLDATSVLARKVGIGIALGGYGQALKQAPDQMATTIANTGRPDLQNQNTATLIRSKESREDAMQLLRKFSVGTRGDAAMGGAKFTNQMESSFSNLERFLIGGKWAKAKFYANKVADTWLVLLKKSDFLAAASGWMTYYQVALEKSGVEFKGWSEEANLVDSDPARQEAAAYAESMIDIYQGSSDPTRMATFAQRGKTGYENAFKTIFLPFNSFVLQQRVRILSDLREIKSKSTDPKSIEEAKRGLAGTLAGILIFHSIRRYALPAIGGLGAASVYALLGVDPEEPDEEKKQAEASFRLKQFYSEIAGNVLVGGFGGLVEQQTLEAMNQAAYFAARSINSDWVLDDNGDVMEYSKWKRDKAPFWYYQDFKSGYDLGMFNIGFDQISTAIEATNKMNDPELMDTLTAEERRVIYLMGLSEWLYLMRLNDADVARMIRRMGKETEATAKEREAEIRKIRAGR